MEIIIIGKEEIAEIVETAVLKAISIQKNEPVTLLSKNQVRKKLKIGYQKLDSLILSGAIKPTPDGKYISEIEITNYLKTEK